MKKAAQLFFTFLFCLFIQNSFGQGRNCYTMPQYQNHINKGISNPSIIKNLQQLKSLPSVQSFDSIVIPVVVHVIYKDAVQHITKAQIESQIRILNEDFSRREGSNGFNTNEVGADTKIRFALAKRDPKGQPTKGIVYKSTNIMQFNIAEEKMKSCLTGGDDPWPSDSYLNIWVCNLEQLYLGYSSFPGEPAELDGIVCDFEYFGDIGTVVPPYHLGRTATHEVGHWLGLFHTWGDDEYSLDKCAGSDFIQDTPNQETPSTSCYVGNHPSCNNENQGGDMYQNYMDYTDDACMNIFTQGQASKMLTVLTCVRSNILFSNALKTVGINETKAIQLIAYPNPTDGVLHFDLDSDAPKNIKVYNNLGQLLQYQNNTLTNEIDISDFQSGIYLVEIKTNSLTYMTRVSKF